MSRLEHLLCPTTNDAFNILLEPQHVKPLSRRCNVLKCFKTAKRGGRCIAHGGSNQCVVPGCLTSVVSRGRCVAHGGGKRCRFPACTKSAQSGGFCWVHGGGKKCGYQGCLKRAQSGGACIAHGGGKRCRSHGCTKVVQYDGLCVGHGGYRRCVFPTCDRRAMANHFCQQHGGSSICRFDECYNRAVRGGVCAEHKAEALLALSSVSNEIQDCNIKKSMDVAKNSQTMVSQNAVYAIDETELSQLENLKDDLAEDSPHAPGFSILLNAWDHFPSIITTPQQQKTKVYPLLPSIRSLGQLSSQDSESNTGHLYQEREVHNRDNNQVPSFRHII